MEACATAHHWARELTRLGHQVKLIPPSYVKAYVRRQKNDMADAAAICEAVTRPTMRFVPIKSAAQQGVLMLHRVRELLVGQRTALINALRGHLAEFGVVAPQGARHVVELVAVVADAGDARLPEIARGALAPLVRQMQRLEAEIGQLDRRLLAWHRADAASRRLATIPGIGPVTASAIAASVTDPSMFGSGREFETVPEAVRGRGEARTATLVPLSHLGPGACPRARRGRPRRPSGRSRFRRVKNTLKTPRPLLYTGTFVELSISEIIDGC
jgi:transposase